MGLGTLGEEIGMDLTKKTLIVVAEAIGIGEGGKNIVTTAIVIITMVAEIMKVEGAVAVTTMTAGHQSGVTMV